MFHMGYWNASGDGYHDFYFLDNSPKKNRRHWIVTYDEDSGSWYGLLQRSDTDDSDWHKEIYMPKAMVFHLATLVPQERFPPGAQLPLLKLRSEIIRRIT